MAETVHEAADALKTLILTVTGVHDPGTTPPTQLTDFPVVLTFPENCTWRVNTSGVSDGSHTLTAELHWPWSTFPASWAEAKSYGETVKNTILSPTANGLTLNTTVDVVAEIRGRFGQHPLGYGRLETYGWVFEVDIEIRNTTG